MTEKRKYTISTNNLTIGYSSKKGITTIASNLNIDLGFKPPNGVGLSIDAGAVKGGGYLYFDYDKEEYAGVLELTFSEIISLKAIGLITTRMPDLSDSSRISLIPSIRFSLTSEAIFSSRVRLLT